MLEILSVVYREINYQNMKRSPQISQEKIVKIIRRFTLRGQVAKTFFIATAFGAMLSPLAFIGSGLGFTFAFTLSLIFSVIAPVQSITVAASSRVFEPLRFLPVEFSEKMLTVFFLDSVFVIGFALPTVAVLTTKDLYLGIYSLLWVLAAMASGYAIAFLYFALFGVKVGKSFSKSVLGGILLFIALSFVFRNFQRIPDITPYLKPQFLVLSYATSAAAIKLSARRVWKAVLNPEIVMPKGGELTAASLLKAMIIKDFRLILRKNAFFTLIIPLIIVMPNVFNVLSYPETSIFLITTISAISVLNMRILANIENLEFLKLLPISKRSFVMSKTSLIFLISFAASLPAGLMASFVAGSPFYLLMSLSIPAIVSALSSLLIFRYKGEEIYFPELGFLKWMGLFLANLLFISAILSPKFLLEEPISSLLSSAISLLVLAVLIEKLRKI